jgi:hypothetical protein
MDGMSVETHSDTRAMALTVLALLFVGVAGNAGAETLVFQAFTIDLDMGWTHRVENRTLPAQGRAELISINRPNGAGVMRIQSYAAPVVVSRDVLRNMTNVDMSTRLQWQDWGDFSGYLHIYHERGSFYKQWWLIHERTLIFISYQCDTGAQAAEIGAVDKMVMSMRISQP